MKKLVKTIIVLGILGLTACKTSPDGTSFVDVDPSLSPNKQVDGTYSAAVKIWNGSAYVLDHNAVWRVYDHSIVDKAISENCGAPPCIEAGYNKQVIQDDMMHYTYNVDTLTFDRGMYSDVHDCRDGSDFSMSSTSVGFRFQANFTYMGQIYQVEGCKITN